MISEKESLSDGGGSRLMIIHNMLLDIRIVHREPRAISNTANIMRRRMSCNILESYQKIVIFRNAPIQLVMIVPGQHSRTGYDFVPLLTKSNNP